MPPDRPTKQSIWGYILFIDYILHMFLLYYLLHFHIFDDVFLHFQSNQITNLKPQFPISDDSGQTFHPDVYHKC